MRSIVLVLLLLGGLGALRGHSQEDARVAELLSKLDDDSIDARSAAAVALIDLGRPVLPALQRAAGPAGVELKDRIQEVIRKIHERERLAALLPAPSRITIDARNLPVREVFEKVARQTTTAIDFSNVPEDLRVTVKLDRVPLWKAIEQICRASGQIMMDLETDHVVISPEPYAALPSKRTDLFCVTLEKVELSTELVFGQQERYERFSADVHVAWEKGAKPFHVSARLTELVDEHGNELVIAGEDSEAAVLSTVAPDQIYRDFLLESTRGPGPSATKLSRLKIEVEFEFPLKYAEVRIDLTGGKFPAGAGCPEFDAKITRMDRIEGALSASLVIVPHAVLEDEITSESVVLRDKNGKEYPVSVNEGSPAGENETPYQLNFPTAPENVEFTTLIIKVPTEVHRERLEVELKDLDLR